MGNSRKHWSRFNHFGWSKKFLTGSNQFLRPKIVYIPSFRLAKSIIRETTLNFIADKQFQPYLSVILFILIELPISELLKKVGLPVIFRLYMSKTDNFIIYRLTGNLSVICPFLSNCPYPNY